MKQAKALSAVALATAGILGLGARSASASPYLTVSLLGSTNAGGPFTSSVNAAPGNTVFYRVQIQLGAEGATNPNAGGANTSIVNWIPSNGATAPTSGINSLWFNMRQTGVGAGQLQANFTAGTTGLATGGTTWGVGAGSTTGTVTPRGDGNNDLIGVKLIRDSGNFDGVAGVPVAANAADPAPAVLELLEIASGSFAVGGGANSSVVSIDTNGFLATDLPAFFRWRTGTAANNFNASSANYSMTGGQLAASIGAGNPIIVFNDLNLIGVPEPTTLGLLALAGVGLLRRRRGR